MAENFDSQFTDEVIKNTPIDVQTNMLDTEMQAYFQNFSFVGHSHLDEHLLDPTTTAI